MTVRYEHSDLQAGSPSVSSDGRERGPGHIIGALDASVRRPGSHAFEVFAILLLLTASLDTFFEVYRIALFDAMPYDDYAPYLLHVLGEPGGAVPRSPFVYRIGSVILAVPFYYMPLVKLNEPAMISDSIEYIRATQAMSAANVFYVFVSCAMTYAYCRIRLKLPREWGLIGALTLFILSHFLGLTSVDGIALPFVTLVAISVFERSMLAFVLTVLVAAFVNEKVAILACLLTGSRFLFAHDDRRFYFKALVAAAAVVAATFVAVSVLQFPGWEHQRTPSKFLSSAAGMIALMFSPRGAYRNLLPPLILIGLWYLSLGAPRKGRISEPADLGVILGIVATAFAVDVRYNVGRIAMYCAPLFVMTATQALASFSSRGVAEDVPIRAPEIENAAAMLTDAAPVSGAPPPVALQGTSRADFG